MKDAVAGEGGGQEEEKQQKLQHASVAETAENGTTPVLPVPLASHAAQLTIFYAGSVSVYDAIPPEKAQAIMLIAAAAAAAAAAVTNNKGDKPPLTRAGTLNAAAASPLLTRSLSLQSSSAAAAAAGAAAMVPASPQPQPLLNHNSSLCKIQSELPIARRHSLQRFLEKRRDRLVSKAPYAPYPSAKISDGMEVAVEVKPTD